MTACEYHVEYDWCNDEEVSCYSYVTIDGEDYEGDCYELQDQFGWEDEDDDEDDHDDECEVECMEPYSCDDMTEDCQMVDCYDHCTMENLCFAEWTDSEGEMKQATCDEFWHYMVCA